MKFNYKSRTAEGNIETGSIEASSSEAAIALLQKYNIFVTSLSQEAERSSFLKDISFERKVSIKDLAIFARQLAVMLESRVPVVQSLASLAVQTPKANFKKTIVAVSHFVEEGIALSDAFAHFPKVFDNFFVNLIKSGEASGKISETLYYISDHLDREHEIKSQVQHAMIYPLFTISILFVVVNIIIIFLLPKVEELILQSSGTPPLSTVITLRFYNFF
jgi:type IV pilus assembly protein PilC